MPKLKKLNPMVKEISRAAYVGYDWDHADIDDVDVCVHESGIARKETNDHMSSK